MTRFDSDARVMEKPADFDGWLWECGLMADTEGAWALIGMWWGSPVECCRYLLTLPGMWEGLLARGRYRDRVRFELGIYVGRRA